MPYADPERQRAARRESARRSRAAQRSGSTAPRGTVTLPLPVRIETAQDILRLLSEAVGEVRAEDRAGALDRARAVGYLAGIALRAVETASLEARLLAVEEAMGLREEGRRGA